jgi:hypothetical protein
MYEAAGLSAAHIVRTALQALGIAVEASAGFAPAIRAVTA